MTLPCVLGPCIWSKKRVTERQIGNVFVTFHCQQVHVVVLGRHVDDSQRNGVGKASGPGYFNDLDFLQIGYKQLSDQVRPTFQPLPDRFLVWTSVALSFR